MSASPVKMCNPQATIKTLHSVMFDTCLLEYTNGVFVRLALPKKYTSSLVGRCLSALKNALQSKEACHELHTEWYCVRNAPGPLSISNAQEWNLFAKCLMQLLGYHTESFNFATEDFSRPASRDNSVTSPRASKKMRPSDDVSFFIVVKLIRRIYLKWFLNVKVLAMLCLIMNIDILNRKSCTYPISRISQNTKNAYFETCFYK